MKGAEYTSYSPGSVARRSRHHGMASLQTLTPSWIPFSVLSSTDRPVHLRGCISDPWLACRREICARRGPRPRTRRHAAFPNTAASLASADMAMNLEQLVRCVDNNLAFTGGCSLVHSSLRRCAAWPHTGHLSIVLATQDLASFSRLLPARPSLFSPQFWTPPPSSPNLGFRPCGERIYRSRVGGADFVSCLVREARSTLALCPWIQSALALLPDVLGGSSELRSHGVESNADRRLPLFLDPGLAEILLVFKVSSGAFLSYHLSRMLAGKAWTIHSQMLSLSPEQLLHARRCSGVPCGTF